MYKNQSGGILDSIHVYICRILERLNKTAIQLMVKKLKNILIFTLLASILLIATGLGVAYYYRNDLIKLFVSEANKNINTPVDIKKIELDLFGHFPDVSINLKEVYVHESTEIAGDYLCRAEKISLSFDLLNLIFKNYELKSLYLENATVNMAMADQGKTNFNIFNKKKDQSNTDLPELFLENIVLKNTLFNYSEKNSDLKISLYTERLSNRLKSANNILYFQVKGDITNKELEVEKSSYLKNKVITLSTDFEYDISSKDLIFNESSLVLNDYAYTMDGRISSGDKKYMNLRINSRDNSIQAIISLLPEKIRNIMSRYKSKGEIEFSGTIQGEIGNNNRPQITAEFKCDKVSFLYPGYNKSFQNISFSGNFSNGEKRNIQSSQLTIKDFTGFIDRHQIGGNLVITDLKNLNSDLKLSGKIDLNSFIKTFPVKQITRGEGLIDFDIRLKGRLRNLKQNYAKEIKTAGEINFENVGIKTIYSELPFRNFNGRFYFNNLDLGIQNFTGLIGKSDFLLSGLFKNLIPYVLTKDSPIRIDADLRSRYLNLNELFTLNFSEKPLDQYNDDSKYHLGISPKLNINFNCNVKRADLKRFHGENISGRLVIKDQIAFVEGVSMSTMGGQLYLGGSIVGKHVVNREFIVEGLLDNIYIDSVFYVFNNFKQQFLIDRNLKGQIDAKVNTYFVLTEDLKLLPATLDADIEAIIKQGQLINFKPIQSLSKYLKNEDLSMVKFSDLQNNIQITNKTVVIPEMEIISSAYHIDVSGTHGFNQEIDYHFKIPLDQFVRSDPDERFGEIEQRDSGPPNLFLKMTGTAVDYQVAYDTRAVTEKIKQDLKKEGDELKDLFRKNKDEKTKQVELEEDDYFDFD